MRKDSWLSLKGNPRFKSQLFKYSVQFVCYFTYSTEEFASGKNCRSWLLKMFYIQIGSFLSYLPSCVSEISKHRPGCCNMKELQTGVRGTNFAAYSFQQSCNPCFLFPMLQMQYWKEAQHSAHQQPGTCTTCGEAQQFFALGKASHRDCNLVHVDLWYLGMDHMLVLVLFSSSVNSSHLLETLFWPTLYTHSLTDFLSH